MKIESEKALELLLKYIIEKKLGGQCLKLLSTFTAGLPDRLCLLPGGRLFFVELKTTKEKPRKIQLFMHKKLSKLGFKVWVIETSEQIHNLHRDYE